MTQISNSKHLSVPLDSVRMASLAYELASDLIPPADIIERYRISAEDLRVLFKKEHFRNLLREYKLEWASPKNAKERVRVKAMLAVEDGLVDLYNIFKDGGLTAAARMEAYKQLTVLADAAPKKDAPAEGGRVSITINLGDKNKPIIDAVVEHVEEAEFEDE